MLEISIPYSFILIFSGLLTGIVAVIAFQFRTRNGAYPLAMIMILVTLWSFCYAGELLSTNLNRIIFWEKLEYIWIATVPPTWLYFSLSLKPWQKLKSKRIIPVILIIPVLVLLFVWTNEFHHLFWSRHQLISTNGMTIMKNTFGPVFWVHFAYSYLLTMGGTVLQFYSFMTTNAISRYGFNLLFIPVFPLLANFIFFVNLNPFQYLDPTLLGFTISGLILLWGGTRNYQLEIAPIAWEIVMDRIDDGLIIVDYLGEVIDANPAARQITGFKTNEPIQAFLLDGFIHSNQDTGPTQIELNGVFSCPYVLMRLTPIYGKKRLAGWVVMLTDITRRKQIAHELEESKERYETIFSGMRDAILIRNPAGQILDVNPAASEMYGYPREDFLRKTMDDLTFKRIFSPVTAENVTNGKITGLPDELKYTANRRANGESFLVAIHEWPLIISSETIYLVVVRDITEKVKTEASLKARERYLRLLNNITWDALAGQDVPEILQTLADRLGELLESCGVFITLWDGEQPDILPGAAYGPMRKTYPKLNPQPALNTMTKTVLENGRPIIIADIYQSPYLCTEVSLFFPARSIMALPLSAGDRKLGAIFVTFDGVHHFTGEDLAWGSQAADQMALSISRAYLMEKTQSLLAETQKLNETLERKVRERTGQLLTANRMLEGEMMERQRIEAIIRNRLEVEHLISNLSSRFMKSENFDQILMDALKAIGYITGGTRVSMFMVRSGAMIDNTHEWCAAGKVSEKENLQNLPVANLSWWMKQLNENHLIQIRDQAAISPEAGAELQMLRVADIRSLLCYPISYDLKLAGFLEIDNLTAADQFPQEDIELLAVLARTISSALYRKLSQERLKHTNEDLLSAYDATIEGWAKALELREKETEGHSERTLFMTIILAEKLHIEREQMEHIRRGVLLHDIGKMVVPDRILQKPGPLSDEEWQIIREHPLYSIKMLSHIDFLQPAMAIPCYHHEKWDGSGYPIGLKGEEIPLAARLFALVDVWDALCSDRPYRKALGWEEALVIIEKGIGTHFDPAIGRVFLEMIQEGEPC